MKSPGISAAALALGATLGLRLLYPAAQDTLRGYDAASQAAELKWEQQARAIPDPAKIRAAMERLSNQAHLAGTPQSKETAEYLLAQLREFGLDAHIEQYESMLPQPKSRTLEMTAPVAFRAKLDEPPVPGDKNSADPGMIPSFNAFSGDGDVTAPLVYVNYGVPADYDTLKERGIDVKGKIVIARYGGSWRGIKPKVAYEHGAVGCLIYSDPKDDGYFQGDTGTINQLVHLWKFTDDAHRRAHWAAVFADPAFMDGFAAKFRPLVMSQEVKLLNAAPWGPHP